MTLANPAAVSSGDQRTNGLLREREARGLAWAARARLGYILLGAMMVPLTSNPAGDRIFTLILMALGVAVSLWILGQANHRRRLTRAAMAGIAFDLLAFALIPMSWYHYMPDGTPAMFLVKARADNIALVLAAVNALCLRPAYPMIVAGAGALQRVCCLAFALADPRTTITWDPVATHLQGQLHPVFLVWEVLSLLIIGGLLSLLTWWARRTVREAIEAEAQNWQLREEQAQMVADAKVVGLSELVAGVAHELNTPLGAARSGFDSMARGIERIAEGLADDATPQLRGQLRTQVLPAMHTAQEAGAQGLSRIGTLMRSLRDFSHLDQAQAQAVDLHIGLDAALDLIPPHLQTEVRVQREYGSLPPVRCRPAELNQVFFTILTNAFEAIAGPGEVRVRTSMRQGMAIVEVEDTGRGISRERLEHLFEVGLATKDQRIGLRLGLPIARRVIHQHGGAISVSSQVGKGTLMSLRLPLA